MKKITPQSLLFLFFLSSRFFAFAQVPTCGTADGYIVRFSNVLGGGTTTCNSGVFEDNAGYVGIGTVVPTARLDVRGDVYADGNLTVDGDVLPNRLLTPIVKTTDLTVATITGDASGPIFFSGGIVAGAQTINFNNGTFEVEYSNSIFRTGDVYFQNIKNFEINDSWIRVGRSEPCITEFYNDVQMYDWLTVGSEHIKDNPTHGTLLTRASEGDTKVDIIGADNTGWDAQLRFYSTNSENDPVLNHVITNKFLVANGNASQRQLTIAPGYSGGGSDILKIDGKLQIGGEKITAGNHTDAVLFIDGKMVGKHCVVTLDHWADDVFCENYELKPLQELKTYVEENKHLPEIPAESEITSNGVNLGEMDAKLIRKIEELTLYVIKLDEENKALKERIEKLEN